MQYTQNTGPNGPDPAAGDGPTPPSEAGASGMGTAAAEKLAETRSAAGGGLDSAASALHQNAERLSGGDAVKRAARTAADALSSTADYVRENDFKGMLADVKKIVKNNPGPALLTAAVLGFLVARTFSRD
jgi:ElaB/YqjD/DUF883 family membrane-anchored ribosome-binding protein